MVLDSTKRIGKIMQQNDLEFLNANIEDKLIEASIEFQSSVITNVNDLLQKVKDFSPVDGWISRQSTSAQRIQSFQQIKQDDEYILAGEFANAANESLSIRFDGISWLATTIKESDNGDVVLKKTTRQLTTLGPKHNIFYSVYYKNEKNLGYRPYASRFVKIEENQQ